MKQKTPSQLATEELYILAIHPVAKGGTNDIDNLTSSCEECNSGKGDTEI